VNFRETAALGAELYGAMTHGEVASLALLSGFSDDQMVRQLHDEARLTADVVFTHLARLPRETALGALEDLLDAHRRRVLPSLSGRQIDLFGRLNR
jgi:hypothetical protein